MKVARIYLRVSTDERDLARQENVINGAKSNGFYAAAAIGRALRGYNRHSQG
jgi:DNA invertase Pin-like site-specific DNA recombinase